MPPLLPADWSVVLLPQTPLAELAVRGTAVYLVVLALMRFVRARAIQQISVADVMLVVLVGAAARQGFAVTPGSVGDATVLVATILAWHWVLRHLAVVWMPAERFLRPAPLAVVRDGAIEERRAGRAGISRAEVEAALRTEGVERIGEVRLAQVEPGGGISVARRETGGDGEGEEEEDGTAGQGDFFVESDEAAPAPSAR